MNLLIDIENKQLIFNDKNVFTTINVENNNPWCKAKDIILILEYKNITKVSYNHVNTKDSKYLFKFKKGSEMELFLNMHPDTVSINTSNLSINTVFSTKTNFLIPIYFS